MIICLKSKNYNGKIYINIIKNKKFKYLIINHYIKILI